MTIMEKLGITSDKWVNYKEDDFDQITWNGEPQCTKDEWETAKTELQAEYDAQEYARNRQAEYPTIQELVVALYDTDDKTAIETKRAEVKAKHPKPE